MGMVVRTNMGAINANRNLNKNSKTNSKSLEKLASGYKINRAGDDASGLAISEKMKAQIKALGTASDNCEDGISLVQTTEGYMTEIHDMLNRMVELAEKSANGINEDSGNTGTTAYGVSGGTQNAGTDRAALQAEMDQLAAEIDRIAMTANFNGNKLLNGALDKNATGILQSDGSQQQSAGKVMTFQIGETANKADKLCLNIKSMATDKLFNALSSTKVISSDGATSQATANLLISNGAGSGTSTVVDPTANTTRGLASANVSGVTINISDQAYASKAAECIRDVIDDVSLQRAQLGATQNRLDYTINNLDTTKENMESANSRIRDTDMAEEMMKYTQSNVLSQAAQAMLAQANTQPQNVLQLLQ
jgi:flagellin